MIPLYKKEEKSNRFNFFGLCVIEIKTKSTLSTINDLEKHIAHDGSKFTVCNAGTRKFKDVVKEPAY